VEALRRIVIIGATSGIARHCARAWLAPGPADLTLVGRDAERLARVEADLKARSPGSHCHSLPTDLLDPAAIEATVATILERGAVDTVLIAHGLLPDQPACQASLTDTREALVVNGMSPVLWAEAFAHAMEDVGRGTLALFGSVAGDRGRKSNYTYGAAKSLVATCAVGMQHRFAGTAVRVVLIKPGPTDTPMTAALKADGARLADVAQVARDTVRAIDRGVPVAYVPGRWRWIMWVIRSLPRAIFNRLDI